MTVQHLVWLKAPEGVSDSDMERLMMKIKQLKTIPAVVDISAGKNFKNTGHGYQYGVIMTYADKAAQRSYIEHPLHKELRDEIKNMNVAMMALDYED